MKFGHSLLTSELRGSAGGLVASVARGGIGFFRARARPGNPNSPAQSRVRLILTALASAWAGTLTDVQRATWTNRASAKESGIDAFIKVNSQLNIGGADSVLSAPSSINLTNLPVSTVVVDASADTITFHNTDFNDDFYCNVYMSSQPQHSSRLAQQFPFTYIGTAHLDAAATNTLSLAAFPALAAAVAGDIVYARFVQYDSNGKVATAQTVRLTVVA